MSRRDPQPETPELLFEQGKSFLRQDRHADAEPLLLAALVMRPDFADARFQLANLYNETERLSAAEAEFRGLLEDHPDHAGARVNLGGVLLKQARAGEAAEVLAAALDDAPEDHVTAGRLALAFLAAGRLEEGWRLFEGRLLHEAHATNLLFPCPRWKGEDLAGKRILVWREQGIGDELRLASCYGEVLERAGACLIAAQPRLVTLLQRSFPQAEVRAADAIDLASEPLDYQVPAASLPLLFRPGVGSFPDHRGYLRPAPERVKHWRKRLSSVGRRPWIGICWRSRLATPENRQHFTTLDAWRGILATRGACFVNLQYDDCRAELAAAPELAIHRFDDIDLMNDLDEAAALTAALDLVVTVGTSVGAVSLKKNTECWSILQDWLPDFLGTKGLPWYPGTRVFRRRWDQPWEDVLAEVADTLPRRLDELAHPPSRNAPCPCGSGERFKHCCGKVG